MGHFSGHSPVQMDLRGSWPLHSQLHRCPPQMEQGWTSQSFLCGWPTPTPQSGQVGCVVILNSFSWRFIRLWHSVCGFRRNSVILTPVAAQEPWPECKSPFVMPLLNTFGPFFSQRHAPPSAGLPRLRCDSSKSTRCPSPTAEFILILTHGLYVLPPLFLFNGPVVADEQGANELLARVLAAFEGER